MLQEYLAINVFNFMLVFARLSVVFLLLPGISAAYVPMRLRLILALLITVLILPVVQPSLPPQPEAPAALVWLVVSEVLIGGFLGALIQILMAALELAGQMISTATGLTNAMVDDPITEEQSAIIIGLLNLIAVAVIFVPNAPLFTKDMLTMASTLLNQAFYMGVRLAAPFLVFEMVFQISSGVLSRLSPQLNVFFVVLPAQIVLGLSILMISLPTVILLFMHFLDNNLHTLLSPPAISTGLRR
jgi:flagellar biosynthetic protein FliR